VHKSYTICCASCTKKTPVSHPGYLRTTTHCPPKLAFSGGFCALPKPRSLSRHCFLFREDSRHSVLRSYRRDTFGICGHCSSVSAFFDSPIRLESILYFSFAIALIFKVTNRQTSDRKRRTNILPFPPIMSSTANAVFRASRPLFRQQQAAQFFTRNAFQQQRTRFQWQQSGGKRWQSSTTAEGQQQSWFKKMWESEVGIKTVHFWYVVLPNR
jgi:hypothetical protein